MQDLQTLSLHLGSFANSIEPSLLEDQLTRAIFQFHSNEVSTFLGFPAEKQKAIYQNQEVSSLEEELIYWEMYEHYEVCVSIRDLIAEKSNYPANAIHFVKP